MEVRIKERIVVGIIIQSSKLTNLDLEEREEVRIVLLAEDTVKLQILMTASNLDLRGNIEEDQMLVVQYIKEEIHLEGVRIE